MALRRGPTGKLLRGPGGSLTRDIACCCPKCNPDSFECTWGVECASTTALCCWKCGDTCSVTFGEIEYTGVGTTAAWIDTAVQLMIPAVENQTIVTALKANFRWYSGELGRDATHVYGASVETGGYRTGVDPTPEAIVWDVVVYVWRVPIADWDIPGVCQNYEEATVIRPVPFNVDSDPYGTCCGKESRNLESFDNYIGTVDPATDIIPSSACPQICDCDELPSSVLIEADCITTTANRGSGECTYSASVTTGSFETCDLVETSIVLRKSNAANGEDEYFCGWVLEIFQTVWGPVGEDCDIVAINDTVATLTGAGPTGTYTVQTGSGCGTSIGVS